MRSVPRRSALLVFLSFTLCLFGGPFLGLGLATLLAPSSDLAGLLSVFAFPAAFLLGLLLWLGLGILTAVVGGLWRLVRGRVRWPPAGRNDNRVPVPAGYGAFVPTVTLLALGAGVFVGFASDEPFLLVLAVYGIAGLLYGILLRALAHTGYLPFPEPE